MCVFEIQYYFIPICLFFTLRELNAVGDRKSYINSELSVPFVIRIMYQNILTMATSMSHYRSWKTNEQHNDTISFTRSNESIRQENTIHIFSSQMSDSLDNALRQFYRSRKITMKNLKPKNFEVIQFLEKANHIFLVGVKKCRKHCRTIYIDNAILKFLANLILNLSLNRSQ